MKVWIRNCEQDIIHVVKMAFRLLPYLYLLLAALVLLSMIAVLLSIKTVLDEPAQQLSKSRQLVALSVLLFIGGGLSIAYILNAIFLLRKINRKASIVLSLISCLGFPLGTIIGVVSLLVLTRAEIKAEYA